MNNLKYILIGGTLAFICFFALQALAAPSTQNFVNIQPFVDNTYDNGSATNAWRDVYTYGLKFSTSTGGCLQSSASGRVFMTGVSCGTGSGSFGFPFTVNPNYNSTTTVIGFLGGLFSTASSTFSGPFRLSALSDGELDVFGGLVGSYASTTFSSPLVYTSSTKAVTCPTCNTSIPFGFPFTVNVGYNSTTSTIGFITGGLFSTASSTFGSSLFLTGLNSTQGILYNGSLGKVNTLATSTLTGSGVISVTAGAYTLGGTPISVSCSTCGTGSVTSVTAGAGHQNQGLVITTSGTLIGAIATSATPVINPAGLAYWTGVGDTSNPAKLGTTATSSIGAGASLSFSGTAGAQVGGTAGTYSINTANTNTWSILQNFNYSSSTIYSSFITASSTNYVGGGLTSCTGSNFLQYTSSNFFGCAASSGGTGTSQWATSTVPVDAIYNSAGGGGGYVGIGTTSPRWTLNVASTTRPQIALTANTTDNEWTFRSIGNNFYIATASPTTFATSSQTIFTINSNGFVGLGTTSPMSPLSVMGNEDHWGNYYHFGPAFVNDTSFCLPTSQCFGYFGNDNTTLGAVIEVGNVTAGTHAYSGLALCNNLCDASLTHYFGLYLTASTYNDTTFGTGLNSPNQLQITNTDGPTTFDNLNATVANSYINFLLGGGASGNEIARIYINGMTIGTTTPSPIATFTVASNTPYMFITDNNGPVGGKQWYENVESGIFSIGTTSDNLLTSTSSALSISAPTIASPNTTFGVGSTSPYATLSVVGANNQDLLAMSTTTAGTTVSLRVDKNGIIYFGNYADCNGTTNALGVTTKQITCDSLVSDIRLKKDVRPITNGLDIITALKPSTFYYSDLTNHNTTDPRQQIGFIAQDVETLIPTAVGISPDGYKTLDKTAIIPYLVNAVQTLSIDKGIVPIKQDDSKVYILGFIFLVYLIYNEIDKRKRK